MILPKPSLLTAGTSQSPVRKRINTLIKGKLYQRAQVLSWTRDDKVKLLNDLHIRAVVNFWPKIDPDWGTLPIDWYWYLPVSRSMNMLSPHILRAACAVADYLKEDNAVALILCEAGKTRSVFFSILVLREVLDCSYANAWQHVLQAVPTAHLKPGMLVWLGETLPVKPTRPRLQAS